MKRVFVNRVAVTVRQEATALQAASAAGIHVPTLCHHPRLANSGGNCRVCLVHVNSDGASMGKPVPACKFVPREGDRIETADPDIKAFRRTDVQLMLSRHPNDCMRCEVSGQCKLQDFVRAEQLEERFGKGKPRGTPQHEENHHHGLASSSTSRVACDGHGKPIEYLHDHSSPSIQRDMDKCIECTLCIQACGPEVQNLNVIGMLERGSGEMPGVSLFHQPLSETNCISCGQCTVVCPVGALTEAPHYHRVLDALDARRGPLVVQVAPATRVAISEEFGLPAGTISTGRLVNALRQVGFTHVFDTNFSADLTILEEATELIHRIEASQNMDVEQKSATLPLFTSCCPGWINWLEINRPDLLSHVSTCKSPQQMLGATIKRGPFARHLESTGQEPPFVVSVMPCTAKKDEASRPGMSLDIDVVVTTRELARMFRARHINLASLPNDAQFDSPLGASTGAAAIFGASGGVMEAAIRSAAQMLGLDQATQQVVAEKATKLRGIGAGVKEVQLDGIGKFAVANGIASAAKLFETDAWKDYVAIEVMACIGGCLGGGGEPKSDDPEVLIKRAKGIYQIDDGMGRSRSVDNIELKQLYKDEFGEPGSHRSHQLLHTTYAPRDKHSPRRVLIQFLDFVDRRAGNQASALFAPNGEWDTAGPLGVLQGRDAITRAILGSLPPNKDTSSFMRHRMEDASQGLVVVDPRGNRNEFHVEVNSEGQIARLRRTPLESAAPGKTQHGH